MEPGGAHQLPAPLFAGEDVDDTVAAADGVSWHGGASRSPRASGKRMAHRTWSRARRGRAAATSQTSAAARPGAARLRHSRCCPRGAGAPHRRLERPAGVTRAQSSRQRQRSPLQASSASRSPMSVTGVPVRKSARSWAARGTACHGTWQSVAFVPLRSAAGTVVGQPRIWGTRGVGFLPKTWPCAAGPPCSSAVATGSTQASCRRNPDPRDRTGAFSG